MTTARSLPPPISYEPSLSVTKRNDRHRETRARRFLGPMPSGAARLASQSPTRRRQPQTLSRPRRESLSSSSSDSSDEEGLRDMIKARAFQFYLRRGGKEEEWGEGTEIRVRKEMRRKWRESEWGRLRSASRQDAKATDRKWVGESFVVGDFLGISLLDDKPRASSDVANTAGPSAPYHSLSTPGASTTETFATAQSSLPTTPPGQDRATLSSPINDSPNSAASMGDTNVHGDTSLHPVFTSSTTALILPDAGPAATENLVPESSRPALKGALLKMGGNDGILMPPRGGKGKKTVRYAETDRVDAEAPAPPTEVLARSGLDVADTSAGAAQNAAPENEVKWGDVIMRDRMLVRVSYAAQDLLGGFDEERSRTARGVEVEYQGEFMVVWRKDRLELYQDYDMRVKSWFARHLHLAYVIPIHSARTTHSLYSFVDMTFCMTSPPTPVDPKGSRLHSTRGGTNIFVFKLKSRSRAVDWFWNLWRQRDGTLPRVVEIRCPTLDTVVRIDIPEQDSWDHTYARFSRANVLALCRRALSRTRDWDFLVERAMRDGDCELELAWRSESKLDWIPEEEDDIEGHRRKWAVLWGLAARNPGTPTNLEFRLGLHAPSHLHMKDGSRLIEPTAIEGFVDRIRPNTQTRQSVYLVTHDGYLFCSPSARSHAPSPPGVSSLTTSGSTDDSSSIRDAEVRRGARQILESEGMTDMRSIIAVRRAFHLSARRREDAPTSVGLAQLNRKSKPWEEDETFQEEVQQTASDHEDEGGEEGLNAAGTAPAKTSLKMKRSFELVMKTGQIVRYEAYSRRVALEWIIRLRELVVYWRKRHHVDAREEMELAQFGRPSVTPHIHSHLEEGDGTPPSPPPDPNASLPALAAFYNWCALDGCRPILRSGRLYVRKGLRGVYKHIVLTLIPGHVVQFAIAPNAAFARRRKGGGGNAINLADAYVCSGTFAARALPSGQFNPNARPVARRYQDGLETDDPEEDTLFVLWYRPNTLGEGLSDHVEPENAKSGEKVAKDNIPQLSTNKKIVVFRTRSKLERDLWCWALNAEIERLVRTRREHELKVRASGELVNF